VCLSLLSGRSPDEAAAIDCLAQPRNHLKMKIVAWKYRMPFCGFMRS
jgi:hypothetical protein